MTRDVGTQSTPPELSSGSTSPSPAPTPSIEDRSIKQDEAEIEDSSSTNLENLINFERKVRLSHSFTFKHKFFLKKIKQSNYKD